jgi:hypothetical protein
MSTLLLALDMSSWGIFGRLALSGISVVEVVRGVTVFELMFLRAVVCTEGRLRNLIFISGAPSFSCGSEPAREGGNTVDEDAECAGLFASRLAPTGAGVDHWFCEQQKSIVERA